MGIVLDGTGTISASGNVYALNVVANNVIPTGGIIMWSGSIATIPTGWYLCNGANGTPDLRDRFVVGAGSTYSVAATGGTADAVVVSHTHTATVTDPGHTHTAPTYFYDSAAPRNVFRASYAATQQDNATTNSSTTGITVSNSTTGVSGTNQNLPPYYALAYIMKS